MAVSKEKIREIYEVLPKPSCNLCGLGSCSQFAGIENMKTRKRNAGRKEDNQR